MNKKRILLLLSILIIPVLLMVGCGDSSSPTTPAVTTPANTTEPAGSTTPAQTQPTTTPQAEEKGTVKLIYVQWACAEAETHIAEAVLEDLGYDVEKEVVSAGPMWTAVAKGDADAFTTAWLPYTHESYWEKYKDDVEVLGTLFDNAKLGLVVPSYVTINSITELNDHKDKFGSRIVGIEPGAGLMIHTEENTIPTYGLEDWNFIESSEAAMIAELTRAVEKQEWIVVTGWAPHWKFFKWDLKILEDPELTLGGAEEIQIIARKGFKEDMPEAANMLSNMKLTDSQLGEVMYKINVDGMDPAEAAREWVNNNQDIVQGWVS
jgi:glycine betaine/proline transport system substrate-binding protein